MFPDLVAMKTTYVSDDAIYKVNNLMNSGGIVALLHKVLMHNYLFPDTAYQFYGLYGQMSEAQRRFLGQISNMIEVPEVNEL